MAYLAIQGRTEKIWTESNPKDRWFNADEGLETVQGLQQWFQDHPGQAKKPVIEALEDFEHVLETVKNADARWHLEIE